MNESTNDNRATDAKLHELLTGEKCWHMNDTSDYYADYTVPSFSDTFVLHKIVPLYTADDTAMHTAELALAPELREDYAKELCEVVDKNDRLINDDDIDLYPRIRHDVLFALITASPAQRAQALVRVLERARGEVGT